MKFFGCIAHYYPREVIGRYPALLDLLFDAIQSTDDTILPIALDTLGFIGTSMEGKFCLAALGMMHFRIAFINLRYFIIYTYKVITL